MRRQFVKAASLAAIAVMALLVSAGNATLPDEGNGIGAAALAPAMLNSCASAPSDACSADLPFAPAPSANCSQNLRCHTATDCPLFHPIGCFWVCVQKCCELDCS